MVKLSESKKSLVLLVLKHNYHFLIIHNIRTFCSARVSVFLFANSLFSKFLPSLLINVVELELGSVGCSNLAKLKRRRFHINSLQSGFHLLGGPRGGASVFYFFTKILHTKSRCHFVS